VTGGILMHPSIRVVHSFGSLSPGFDHSRLCFVHSLTSSLVLHRPSYSASSRLSVDTRLRHTRLLRPSHLLHPSILPSHSSLPDTYLRHVTIPLHYLYGKIAEQVVFLFQLRLGSMQGRRLLLLPGASDNLHAFIVHGCIGINVMECLDAMSMPF